MIQLEALTKVFGDGPDATTVLDHLDFAVPSGQIAAVVGPSGAGKSTLAQCVTLLERPTSGRVVVNGDDLTAFGERDLRVARRRIGTIFQSDGLFARRTAAENVALPLQFLGVTAAESRARVAELLDRVGLAHKAGHYPHQLSGGQRQRIGIARALALRPSVLLSDEATSGLDPDSTATIVALLKELRDELGLSILFITHEMDTVVQIADTVARLDHGRIVESGRIVDLLRDASSLLGDQLRPARAAAAAEDGDVAIDVSYTTAVDGDWVARVSRELGADLRLLGASIEQVHGATVGTARVAVPSAAYARALPLLAAAGLTARAAEPIRTTSFTDAEDAEDAEDLEAVA
ncbi:ATP-binding cassette domain-containing protein [Microbacterium aoyamense]|uniref:ATP-binding cassette domain-containing protein n=1 Tax=Microbacterium aoyamense TaxID=344166 RepID=A0ABP5BDJ8_9MICO|nr:ATP-binding cassette domain-containing protein [Microbacterium aoyamense]